MDLGLQDQVAFVTGSSRGLGFAIARGLAAEGCRLAICSRNRDGIEGSADRLRTEFGTDVVPLAMDLSVAGEAERFVHEATGRLGAAHALVINTGGPPAATFSDTAQEDWRAAYELLLHPVQALVRACVPGMTERSYGRILAVTSVAVKAPIGHLVLSNSLRAGVAGLMKTLSRELAPGGILVNTLCPGYHLTERLKDLARIQAERAGVTVEEILEGMASKVPVGRIGDPDEFAALAIFLASPRSSYLSGTMIQVDGGLYEGLV